MRCVLCSVRCALCAVLCVLCAEERREEQHALCCVRCAVCGVRWYGVLIQVFLSFFLSSYH